MSREYPFEFDAVTRREVGTLEEIEVAFTAISLLVGPMDYEGYGPRSAQARRAWGEAFNKIVKPLSREYAFPSDAYRRILYDYLLWEAEQNVQVYDTTLHRYRRRTAADDAADQRDQERGTHAGEG